MMNTDPRWSTEWKSVIDTGTSALASFIVTVQVQVVASGCSGRPSPGTIGPLTVILTWNAGVFASTPNPSTWRAGLASVPTKAASTVGLSVFFGRKLG